MKKYQNFLSENFHVLMVKFSVYLNRRVFVMNCQGHVILQRFFGGGDFFFFFFFLLTDYIDVESASRYAAGKHRISTTMNISDSCVIHIVIVVCLPSE